MAAEPRTRRTLTAMSPFYFLLVVGSLTAASGADWMPLAAGDNGVAPPLWRAIISAVGIVAGWGLLSHVSARWTAASIRGGDLSVADGVRLMRRQMGGFRWIGLAAVLVAMAISGLPLALEFDPTLAEWATLKTLVAIAPAMMLTVMLFSAEHTFRVELDLESRGWRQRLARVVTAVRGSLAMLVVPVLVIMVVSDAITCTGLADRLREHLGGGGLWLVGILTGGILIAGLPRLLRSILRGRPIGGTQSAWLADITRGGGLGRTPMHRWDTGGQIHNAMVAGLIGRREIWLTDRLLDELSPPELAMVVLHEVAHVTRRHMAIRMLALVPAWLIPISLQSTLPGGPATQLFTTLAGIALTMLSLRVVSHRGEFDADAVACRTAASLSDVDHVPATVDDAALALASALIRVSGDAATIQQGGWLHPSTAERIHRLIGDRSNAELPIDYSTFSKSSKSPSPSVIGGSLAPGWSELPKPNSAEISSSISIS